MSSSQSSTTAGDQAIIAAIADDLPAGIWVAKVPCGTLIYSNRAFREILGMEARPDVEAGNYAQPYGICDRAGQPYPEDRMPFVLAIARRAVVVVDDLVIHRTDGSRVNVRATAKPSFDESGAITQVAIAFFDITREVQAERARAEAESRLRTVIDGAPIVLWGLDTKGIITLSEGRALSSLGLRAGEAVGRSIFDLYAAHPDICEHSRAVLRGESRPMRVNVGGAFFEGQLEPIRDEAGGVVGAVGVATDVSLQRQMETRAMQSDRLASMGRLAASVAHEVNSPLQYVLSSLELAEARAARSDQPLRQCIADAREGAERVKAIAQDLRTFARPDLERILPVDLRVLLSSALRMCSVETAHRAELVEHHAPCPPVSANEARLGQVLLNLILNAAQAIPEGDRARRHRITISTGTDEGGWAVFEVSDTGEGIPAAVLPRIFEPFFSTKPIGVGTGLGLSVCKSIVEGLGGTISVQSVPGRGSCFRVRLPPARSHHAPAPPAVPPPDPTRARILIIDDDRNLGRVLASALAEHETHVADGGEEGLRLLLGETRYDLVLCDLMMRDLTGMELYRELKARRPGLEMELVLMTGGAFTPAAHSFLTEVTNERLEKPFDAHTEVARLLARRNSQRQSVA